MKNKKERIKDTIFIIVMVMIVLPSLGLLMYFTLPMYEKTCLENYANDYCEEINMSLDGSYNDYFYCEKPFDKRLYEYSVKKKFYYLDNELEDCLTKKKYSFFKIKGMGE